VLKILLTARAAAKRLRDAPFLNRLLTSAVRGAFSTSAFPPESVVRHLPRVGPVRQRLPNGACLHMWSGGDDWVPNQLFWRGWDGYESETARVFFRLAERARVTIDVGAHVGYYTLLAAHANPDGRVIALEPLQPTFERLRRNVSMNRLENVLCLAIAASDSDGEAPMHVPREGLIPCSAGLGEASCRDWVEHCTTTIVQTGTLDRLARTHGIEGVDLIKIDTEGSEPQVLRGATELLRRHRPAIVCEVLEVSQTATALEDLLGPLGYRYAMLTPSGARPCSSIKGDPVHFNYLFTPAGDDSR
jgi:FkbM family methyltransferase